MKSLHPDHIDTIAGRRLNDTDTFAFRCHSHVGCFNRCCRNLNLFLYPYDVIRLKNHLGISSDLFLEKYVDIVLRKNSFFPEVLLKMSENEEKTCPFLISWGCSVYENRPDTCRWFPVEVGVLLTDDGRKPSPVYFFRPPDFCEGRHESTVWTIQTWEKDQEAEKHHRMTILWATLKRLFEKDPWGMEGPYGRKSKMAFMATYNVDRFRDFIDRSSFLKRYHIPSKLKKSLRNDDVALMKLGFDWVKWFLWGIRSQTFTEK